MLIFVSEKNRPLLFAKVVYCHGRADDFKLLRTSISGTGKHLLKYQLNNVMLRLTPEASFTELD